MARLPDAAPLASHHLRCQSGDLHRLTAKTFRPVVEDPERTVAVFFFDEGPDTVQLLIIARSVASAMQKRPDVVVAWLDACRSASNPLLRHLWGEPPQDALPRVLVYPKGKKEGLELNEFRSVPPPTVDHLVAYILQADRDYPAPDRPVQWWKDFCGDPTCKSMPRPLPEADGEHPSYSYDQLKDMLFDVLKSRDIILLDSAKLSHLVSETRGRAAQAGQQCLAHAPEGNAHATSLDPSDAPIKAPRRPFRSRSQPAFPSPLLTSTNAAAKPKVSKDDSVNLYGAYIAKCNIAVPPPTGVYRPPKRKRRFFDL